MSIEQLDRFPKMALAIERSASWKKSQEVLQKLIAGAPRVVSIRQIFAHVGQGFLDVVMAVETNEEDEWDKVADLKYVVSLNVLDPTIKFSDADLASGGLQKLEEILRPGSVMIYSREQPQEQ